MKKTNKEEIAKQRIKNLFEQAEKVFDEKPNLANRYVKIARKIAMKINLKFPRGLKRKFCKHCYLYLKPGTNCRIRTKNKKVVYYCQNCKKYMRFPLPKKS
jgi:ribonuclease P protein subunit RPR2